MAGAVIRIEIQGADTLNRLANRLAGVDSDELLDGVGAMLERQTRRRISHDKESPDDIPWRNVSAKWLRRKRLRSSGGILEYQGALYDSIQTTQQNGVVTTGTNLLYAATHQFGDARRNIPRREFIGLSDENVADVTALVNDWLEGLLDG